MFVGGLLINMPKSYEVDVKYDADVEKRKANIEQRASTRYRSVSSALVSLKDDGAYLGASLIVARKVSTQSIEGYMRNVASQRSPLPVEGLRLHSDRSVNEEEVAYHAKIVPDRSPFDRLLHSRQIRCNEEIYTKEPFVATYETDGTGCFNDQYSLLGVLQPNGSCAYPYGAVQEYTVFVASVVSAALSERRKRGPYRGSLPHRQA